MTYPNERRRHERHTVSFSAEIGRLFSHPDPSAKTKFPARMVDISLSGARFSLRELVHSHEKIRITLSDGNTDLRLDCSGTVVWSSRVSGGYEMGVQFDKIEKLRQPTPSQGYEAESSPEREAIRARKTPSQ